MKKQQEIRVTDAEWDVMDAIWALESIAIDSNEIQAVGHPPKLVIESVQRQRDWNHRTIRTLLSRLVEKNAIKVNVKGSKHTYRSAVGRDDCVRMAAKSFTKRFFGGSMKSMLLHFVENGELSESDLAEIRRSLSDKQRKSENQSGRPSTALRSDTANLL